MFIKEVSDGTTAYRLWRKDGKPEIEYPRCDNDRYILHVEVNSYLIPLRMTEFQMIDNCGYLPAVNELYGSKEGRVAFFNELRERDGWNQPTSVSEAMKREEEVVTRLGSQPERWVASISKQLASHVKFYLQSEKNGGLTHPDYVGACVLNKLDECMKLSEAHQEYIQKEKEKIAAEEAEKRHREAEEINAKAKQEIEAAVKIIREGGRLNNDRIDYRVGDVGHNEPIVLLLMRRYKVSVPLRTQGWICSKLANVTIKDGRCDYTYRRRTAASSISLQASLSLPKIRIEGAAVRGRFVPVVVDDSFHLRTVPERNIRTDAVSVQPSSLQLPAGQPAGEWFSAKLPHKVASSVEPAPDFCAFALHAANELYVDGLRRVSLRVVLVCVP